MKKFKKAMALSLALAMGLSLVACGDKKEETTTEATTTEATTTEAAATDDATADDASASNAEVSLPMPAEDSDPIYVYSWNTELGDRLQYVKDKYPQYADLIQYENLGLGGTSDEYKSAIENAIANGGDKVPSIIACDDDVALYFLNSEAIVPVEDLGITADMYSNAYQYTVDYATIDGKLKGMCWQATPGCFIYRTDIAKEVLGTDDPAKVQEYVKDWDTFLDTAETMKQAGYKMLSGYDDSYRVFSNNVSAPWVDSNNKIVIDDNIMKWVDQTKKYTDKGYNNKSSLWDSTWAADQGPSGKVFGFFYSTWGINFTLLGNSLATPVKEGGKEEVGNGIYGDYAVCEGPQSYYWGGTWICAAAGTDNANLVKDVMKTLCCDKATMKKITEDTQDYTNTTSGMNEIASSNFKSDFLGGQNHIKLFAKSAPKISMKNISSYDQGLNEEFQKAMKDYFDGNVTKDKALDNFYKAAIEKYPNLSK